VWSIDGALLNLDDGHHTIRASETDAAGNLGSATIEFTLDSHAPTVNIIGGTSLGSTVSITLDLGESLKITGSPTLSLDGGGTATYDAKHSDLADGVLAFSYKVPVGQTVSDLQIDHVNLGTAVISDLAGNKALDFSGANGADVGLYGGAGNDTIGVSDLNRAHIDGGAGTDTLQLNGSGQTFDFTGLADSKVQNIEAIDFTGSGDNELDLAAHNVFNFSNTPNANFTGAAADVHRMVIIGNDGDDLHLANSPDAVWQPGSVQFNLNGTSGGPYDFYDLVQDGDVVVASIAVDHHVVVTTHDLV
jgi:hypothetical protein